MKKEKKIALCEETGFGLSRLCKLFDENENKPRHSRLSETIEYFACKLLDVYILCPIQKRIRILSRLITGGSYRVWRDLINWSIDGRERK